MGTTFGTNGESRTHNCVASRNQSDVDWTTEDTSFFVLQGTDLKDRPNEKSLEPLIETDGDETMMESHGDDDAGETGAVRSYHRIKGLLHMRHVVTIGVVHLLV